MGCSISPPDSTQGDEALVQPESVTIVAIKAGIKASHVTAHDVAAFILMQQGEMTAMKLQKLVYYSQAWSLVWDEEPLFDEPIQAWANGPVIPALYARHQGHFKVKEWQGDPSKLTDPQRETITKVLEFYGLMAPQVLSDLTHTEKPWLNARSGLSVGDRGSRVISLADMAEYYSSLS
jgi:uncharacterized phage-associated protein